MKLKIKPHVLHIIARITKRLLEYFISRIDCLECNKDKQSSSQS